jgi:hypothetical protein
MSAASRKTVGARRAALSGWDEVDRLLETAAALRGSALVPRGIYRFLGHEDAHAGMLRTTARSHARRASPTSRASAAR